MTITADWVLGILGVLMVSAIVGLINHIFTDGKRQQRQLDFEHEMARELLSIHAQIDRGMLPRTEERFNSIEQRIDRIESRKDIA